MNQGKIQGVSALIYRFDSARATDNGTDGSALLKQLFPGFSEKLLDKTIYVSASMVKETDEEYFSRIHASVDAVDGNHVNVQKLVSASPRFENAVFLGKEGYFVDGKSYGYDGGEISGPITFVSTSAVEKMSKSKFNTINPDELVQKYGADTFRMYEMFLGPIEQDKPWDTKGIEGVHRFLKKLWRLFYDELKGKVWNEDAPTDAEMKVLHRAIKKIEEDNERFSFNTSVSAFMVCVNELHDLKSHKKAILEQLLILLSPFAPHITEELWSLIGNKGSILDAAYPLFEKKFLEESSRNYPISVNGKVRTQMDISLQAGQEEVEKIILQNDVIKKWLDGKPPKKIIYVKGRMANVVI